MKLNEAREKLNEISNRPFDIIFSPEDLKTIRINKGKTGQLLELALGMNLSTTNLDFEDGELKTNKCDAHGNPKETIFITQINSIIDDLIENRPFEETRLYEKISNILYVPVCKDGPTADWMFLPSIQINIEDSAYSELKNLWKNDYNSICNQLREHIENSQDGFIHTSSGEHLQVRSKDSKNKLGNYNPIFSKIYNRHVSNKNHAFYFKKSFVEDIKRISIEKNSQLIK